MLQRVLIALFGLLVSAPAQNTLFVSGARVMPGETGSATVVLTARERAISTLQFDLHHDGLTLTVTGRTDLADKNLDFRPVDEGRTRFIIWGLNRTAVETSEVVALRWSATEEAEGLHTIRVSNVIASDPDGHGVAVLPADSSVGIARDPAPLVHPGGVVSSGGFGRGTVPGSLISIFGERLASDPPDTQVTVNGIHLSLFYTSPAQLNALVPWELSVGPAELVVTVDGVSSPPLIAPVDRPSPGIFVHGGNRAVASNASGAPNGPDTPARPGETVTIFLTGAGPVDENEPPRVLSGFSCTIGGESASASYLGFAPGWIGVYQLNVAVPALAPGDHPVVLTIDGTASNAAMLTIGN